MAKKNAKQKKKGRGNKKTSKGPSSETKLTSWVSEIGWVCCSQNDKNGEESSETMPDARHFPRVQTNDDDAVSIISWNVLAQSYLTKRSHCGLPQKFQSIVFSRKQRLALLRNSLIRLSCIRDKTEDDSKIQTDILCLQEVDQREVREQLNELGYQGVSTPTTNGGGGGRVDACCIYYLQSKWTLVRSLVVQLDDLAFNTRSSSSEPATTRSLKDDPLRGLQQAFLRRNAAILVELRNRTGDTLVVANAHLYWNPDQEHVKLCQIHYVMEKLRMFNSQQCPLVLCGDLNSLPKSTVHQYLSRGHVNAKRVAPWHHWDDTDRDETDLSNEKQQIEMNGSHRETSTPVLDELSDKMANKRLSDEAPSRDNTTNEFNNGDTLFNATTAAQLQSTPSVKYMLDFTLNKLTRWLRILGIDAALETTEEEQARTKDANIILFKRCREEKRTLLTTSSKLMLRKDCPPGAYLVNARNLEESLVHLLFSHGVVLEPRNFLTRCVVCNGSIIAVTDVNHKRRIFSDHDAPDLSEELSVYCCDRCGQGYWWCDKPSSSAARVKTQATKLFELCLRGGIPVNGDLRMFDFVNVEQQREAGKEERRKLENDCLDVIDWLKDEHLSHKLPLKSAYAATTESKESYKELLPFTNVTADFVGTLDYIFFDEVSLGQTRRLHAPCSFEELGGSNELRNGHLLPSNIWPSDHLAIGACVSFGHSKKTSKESSQPAESTESDVPFCGIVNANPPIQPEVSHGTRCDCGCVPNVLSLFEMAELRKQARLRAAKREGRRASATA